MKKKYLLVSTLALTLFLGIPASAQIIKQEAGTIYVSESTVKEIPPNQAEISIGIKTEDKSLQKAAEENKITANKVYSEIKALLGADDYLETNSYKVSPQYTYTKDRKRVLDKYVVSNNVKVKTKNIELISKIIDTAITNGANSLNQLNFSVAGDDYKSECNDALAELTKKAYDKANAIAKSINSKVTGVKSINASCNTENPTRNFYSAFELSDSAKGSENLSTPTEAGKTNINVSITATFYVK
jgi:uncharacterized protein YggE